MPDGIRDEDDAAFPRDGFQGSFQIGGNRRRQGDGVRSHQCRSTEVVSSPIVQRWRCETMMCARQFEMSAIAASTLRLCSGHRRGGFRFVGSSASLPTKNCPTQLSLSVVIGPSVAVCLHGRAPVTAIFAPRIVGVPGHAIGAAQTRRLPLVLVHDSQAFMRATPARAARRPRPPAASSPGPDSRSVSAH